MTDALRWQRLVLLVLIWLPELLAFTKALTIASSNQGKWFKSRNVRLHGVKDVSDINSKFPLQNDLLLRAARGERTERTPVWVFRQAGRHLPEYMEYKAMRGKNFLELLDSPDDITECTLQPVRRYEVDAAIVFSDILVLLQAMGIEVSMPGGQGITVPRPIMSPADFDARIHGPIDVRGKLAHILRAVTQIKESLKGKVPLIGFSAAPWTLFFYLVGGHSKRNQSVATNWLRHHPVESGAILDKLADVVVEYLVAQVEHGADVIQLFEAMGEHIAPVDFEEWALPRLQRIASAFHRRCPSTPLMCFPRGMCSSVAPLHAAGYNVLSIDTNTSPEQTRRLLPPGAVLQGNFNVALLQRRAGHSLEDDLERVDNAVRQMLEAFQTPQHLIANLGEGLTGKEDPSLVNCFVDSVHRRSAEMTHNSSVNHL